MINIFAQVLPKQNSANQIAVDTGIQVIKEYNHTGYLTYEGALILAWSSIFLATSTIANVVNLIKVGGTARKNIIAYLQPEHFQDKEYIEDILNEMLLTSQSDRVCLGILHNGTSWGNLHFTKMSVRYEARRIGIESVKTILVDVDIERIKEEVRGYSDSEFKYFSKEDSNLSPGCVAYLDNFGIKSVYSRLLSSKESMTNKLFNKFIKPKEVGIYAILELQKISDEPTHIRGAEEQAKTKQKLEELYQKLLWTMDRVRKGKRLTCR